MPKRKRDDDEENGSPTIEDQALRIRVSRLVAKVALGRKSIASALKLARGFERQKLGRRQKAAQQEPRDLLRLKEEVIVLKQLELVDTAKKYLFKQLVKTKRIRESPAFIRVYGEDPEIEGPKPGASANVVGRLFNSNPVKEVMPAIMSGIYGCLGIEERQPGSDSKEPKSQIRNRDSNLTGIAEDEFQGFSEAEVDQDLDPKANRGAEDSEELEFLEYGDRLASSSDELEEAEKDIHLQVRPVGAIPGQNHDRQASEPFSDLSTALSVSGSSSSSSPHPKPRATKPTQLKQLSTSFLPSLINGGYYSGSESNDDEADQLYNNSSDLRKVRNNRRGQRARQQIAEKKYGTKAKHLAKQERQAVDGRDGGWDAQRGATDANGRKGKFGRSTGSSFPRKTQGLTGANADAVKGRVFKAKSDGPLHPSWEAAKKRKEEQKPSLAFSGKRIMFD